MKYVIGITIVIILGVYIKMEVLDMNNKAIDESKVALKSSDPNNLTEEDKKHVSNIRNRTAFNEAYKRS